ncbi:hypothetical protein RF11_03344 [Thelohanellus kitauei]|uniref:Uncharacterized protein n=1 Tax=Thelohanellus kitauei TaxID=669202 RepID=A0A0C2IZR1_THEKT|nr:hypothetical protein RF11_03344 [Thelohanellus kitauei]
MGDPMPKFMTDQLFIPDDINPRFPIVVNMVNEYTYYYFNHTIYRYIEREMDTDKTELYRLAFNISSMAIDHYLDLLFILDTNNNLFVISMKTNFVKLLAPNVTDFEYSNNNLYALPNLRSITFTKPSQICLYHLDSYIECSATDLDVIKFKVDEEYGYISLILQNRSLLIYQDLKMNLKISQQVITRLVVIFRSIS